jgi:hypothetical protein
MTKNSAIKLGRVSVLAAIFVFLAGCGPRAAPRDQTPGEQAIMKLGRAYTLFASTAKDGLGPASPEELKKWLMENDKQLTDLGLSKGEVDGIFVSPRDGQPYQVHPKRHPSPFSITGASGAPGKGGPGRGGPPGKGKAPGYGLPGILVNEKAGVDGKRMVFMSGSQMQEVDEAEFNRLLSGS